jgi:hypothetical protein
MVKLKLTRSRIERCMDDKQYPLTECHYSLEELKFTAHYDTLIEDPAPSVDMLFMRGYIQKPQPISNPKNQEHCNARLICITLSSSMMRFTTDLNLPRNYTPCAVFLPLKTASFRQRPRLLDEEGCRSALMADRISCHTNKVQGATSQ